MTSDDIIAMAREAGALFNEDHGTPLAREKARQRLLAFADLVTAKDRQKHQADIELWKGEAAKAEKWRSLALAKDGDGRTVQRIQQEAAEAEREACAATCENTLVGQQGQRAQDACAAAIRARNKP